MKKFEKLSRAEMKNVMGGKPETCTVTVTCVGGSISCTGGTCARVADTPQTNGSVTCDSVTTKC